MDFCIILFLGQKGQPWEAAFGQDQRFFCPVLEFRMQTPVQQHSGRKSLLAAFLLAAFGDCKELCSLSHLIFSSTEHPVLKGTFKQVLFLKMI